MSNSTTTGSELPQNQQESHDKCFHPSGEVVDLPTADAEKSIPARFEKIVRRFPHRIAVKTRERAITYKDLNKAANRTAHTLLDRRGKGIE